MTDQPTISALMLDLHRYHRQLAELRHRLKKGLQLINYQKGQQAKIQEKLNQLHEEHKDLLLEAKNIEKTLQASEDSLEKRRTQLGEAKTNKEYNSLKLQIETDEKTNNNIAENALEAIEAAERFAESITVTQKEWDELSAKIANAEKEYKEEKPFLLADIEKYTARLAESESFLPFAFEELYRRLVDKLGGEQALAPVQNETYCGHCNQQIPLQFVTEIVNGKPYTCQGCGRLLYVPEGFVLH